MAGMTIPFNKPPQIEQSLACIEDDFHHGNLRGNAGGAANFVKMVLQVACGEAPDFTRIHNPEPVGSVFLFTKEDVKTLEDLQRHQPEKIIRIVDFHPENVEKTTDSSNRAGCYIRKV